MRRSELELSINWVRRLLPDDDQIVVIGSQSILGSFNEVLLPNDARLSMEVDILPLHDPDEQKADLIEVMLGRDSTFHERFGVYVDGVSPTTSKFAPGWLARTIPFVVTDPSGAVPDTVAWCAHPADLVANKLTVGREKDMLFCRAVLRQRLVDPAVVASFVNDVDGIAPSARQIALQIIESHTAPAGTIFATIKPRSSVELSPPTLEDLPTIYDTDHR
jgi:hypothetical protein